MKAIIINDVNKDKDSLLSAAIDDYNLRHVKEDEIILHMFQEKAINMGYDDLKMPRLKEGLKYLSSQNETVVLRSSGGRSIVADEGVLNLSLIFRSKNTVQENYDYFSEFILTSLSSISKDIKVGLIEGACCPGDSDMSISNKKFCGTAQRKVKDSVSLVAYISINKDQARRNDLIKNFYDVCQPNDLEINTSTMDSLEVLSSKSITVQSVSKLFEKEISRRVTMTMYKNNIEDEAGFEESYLITKNRNTMNLTLE